MKRNGRSLVVLDDLSSGVAAWLPSASLRDYVKLRNLRIIDELAGTVLTLPMGAWMTKAQISVFNHVPNSAPIDAKFM